MAITRRKQDSLVDVDLVSEKKISDIIPNDIKDKDQIEVLVKSESKGPGFWQTTWEEIKKVEWPTWNYVLRWSGIIIIFTSLISVVLGFFDHSFTGGIKLIDCTSQVKSDYNNKYKECGTQFVEYITYR